MSSSTGLQRVGVLGATGYAGAEACTLLENHPHFDLSVAMGSRQGVQPGAPELPGDRVIAPLDLDRLARTSDAVVLGTPHGASAELAVQCLERGLTVLDLSADFRLRDPGVYSAHYGLEHPAPALLEEAVYGLTEWCRDELQDDPAPRLIACPGCYPTSVLLPLKPLLEEEILRTDTPIIADCKSGASGAGRTAKQRTHFGSVHDNFLAYGVGTHRHTPEIQQEAGIATVRFVPHLLPVFRGILATIYVTPSGNAAADDLRDILMESYADAPFVQTYDRGLPELNRVAQTNQCHIGVAQVAEDTVALISAIDNLQKGAAGQAIQNLNLLAGRLETEGLR